MAATAAAPGVNVSPAGAAVAGRNVLPAIGAACLVRVVLFVGGELRPLDDCVRAAEPGDGVAAAAVLCVAVRGNVGLVV